MLKSNSLSKGNIISGKKSKFLKNSSSTPAIRIEEAILDIKPRKYPKASKVSYQEYTGVLKKKMQKYRGQILIDPDDTIENEKEMKKETRLLTKEEKRFLQRFHNINKSFYQKAYSPNQLDLSKISVKKDIEYLSPSHSLGVLKANNKVINDLEKTNVNRQKVLYDKSIKTFEAFSMKYKVQMPKIRITAMMPKIASSIPVVDRIEKKNKRQSVIKNWTTIKGKDNLYGYFRYPNKNFPECREQFSLTLQGNTIILIGGMCSVMKTTFIWRMELDSLSWTRVTANNFVQNRYGHTSVIYQNIVYVFGGKTKYADDSVNFLMGLELFNLDEKIWIQPGIQRKNSPVTRRNHVAEIIGGYMVIHGGIDEEEQILGDLYMLSLGGLMKWVKCSVYSETKGPCIFGHAAALVVPSNIRTSYKFNIYKYPEAVISKGLSSPLDSKRGWYIFGGKSKLDGGLSNDMWMLIIGQKPLVWRKIVEASGIKPAPRYFHTMNYYENGGYLIIHGGRNDEKSDSFALDDTFIFNIENYNWIRVEILSQVKNFRVLNRCAHSSVIYSNKLIIFGGMNNNNYLGSALFIVNLDWDYSPDLKMAEEIIIDKIKQDKMNGHNEADSLEMHNKIEKLKSKIEKNQLGMVTYLNLPPIK